MKITTVCLLLCIAGLCLIIPHSVLTQPNNATTTIRLNQEQIAQDTLNEVRQLKNMIQHMNRTTHRTLVLLERIRLYQEQVLRQTQEINDVRDKLTEIKGKHLKLKEAFEETKKAKDAGLAGERDMKSISFEIDTLTQLEQNLLERELRLSAEIDSARANLNDLNRELDAIEQELIKPVTKEGRG